MCFDLLLNTFPRSYDDARKTTEEKNNMSIRNKALAEIIGSSKQNFVTCNINDLSTLVTRSQPVKDFTDRFITHLGKFADR